MIRMPLRFNHKPPCLGCIPPSPPLPKVVQKGSLGLSLFTPTNGALRLAQCGIVQLRGLGEFCRVEEVVSIKRGQGDSYKEHFHKLACLLPLFSIPVSVANRLENVQLDLRMEEEKRYNQFTRRLFVHFLSNFNDWDYKTE